MYLDLSLDICTAKQDKNTEEENHVLQCTQWSFRSLQQEGCEVSSRAMIEIKS